MSNSLVGLNRPIVQPILVDLNYPPYVPENIQIHPDVRYLLPYICSIVINTVVTNINKHHGRLLMFNLISNNYYRNDEFHEIIELCLGYIYSRTKRGYYPNFDSAVNQCVEEMCTMYSSQLIFKYPEIKSLVPPQVVSGAMQNIHKFNEAKAEVSAMFAHNGQYPNHQVGFPGGFQHGVVSNPNYPPNINPNQFPPNNNMPLHINQYPQNIQQGNSMFVNQQRFINRQDNDHVSNVRNDRFSKMIKEDDVSRNRFNNQQSFEDTIQNSQQDIVQDNEVIEPPKKETDPTVMLEMVESNETTFANSTVSFIANSVELNNTERQALQWRSVQHISKETIDEDSGDNFYLSPITLLETNIENAIISGRAKQFERQGKALNKNIFRCFSIITNPFFTTFDFSKYHKTLQSCNTFEQLVLKLRSIATVLANQEDIEYTAGVITYLNLVDGMLTDLINDFLRNKVDLRVKIESFCEDASELRMHLIKKGIQYSDAYDVFEEDIIDSMFVEIDDETLALEETDMQLPKGLNFYLFPINHSLTFTFLNNKELGLNIKDGLNQIDIKRSPTLFRIVQDLFNQKKQTETTTLVDMLVTVDNHRYKLYKDYCESNIYYIRKA